MTCLAGTEAGTLGAGNVEQSGSHVTHPQVSLSYKEPRRFKLNVQGYVPGMTT